MIDDGDAPIEKLRRRRLKRSCAEKSLKMLKLLPKRKLWKRLETAPLHQCRWKRKTEILVKVPSLQRV